MTSPAQLRSVPVPACLTRDDAITKPSSFVMTSTVLALCGNKPESLAQASGMDERGRVMAAIGRTSYTKSVPLTIEVDTDDGVVVAAYVRVDLSRFGSVPLMDFGDMAVRYPLDGFRDAIARAGLSSVRLVAVAS